MFSPASSFIKSFPLAVDTPDKIRIMVVINIRSAINFSLLMNMGDWKGGRNFGRLEDWKNVFAKFPTLHPSSIPSF
jgi:hypothetical protein